MAQISKEYLEVHKCREFNPVAHYFARGDFVTYFFRNDRCYAQRVDDLLTVYLANASGELVGCKIKGVQHILDTAGDFGVRVDGGPLTLGLFFVGASLARNDEQRKWYRELRPAKDAPLTRRAMTAT